MLVQFVNDVAPFVGRGRCGCVDWKGLVLLPRYSEYASDAGRANLSERWKKLKRGRPSGAADEALVLLKQLNLDTL